MSYILTGNVGYYSRTDVPNYGSSEIFIFFKIICFSIYIFTARCYASALLDMGLCLCLCLCPSVTRQCSTKKAKCRITQTTPHHTPRDSSFVMPKISAKFDRGHPLRGRQMQVGCVKIGDLRQITGYILTYNDRTVTHLHIKWGVALGPLSSELVLDICPLPGYMPP